MNIILVKVVRIIRPNTTLILQINVCMCEIKHIKFEIYKNYDNKRSYYGRKKTQVITIKRILKSIGLESKVYGPCFHLIYGNPIKYQAG